MSTLKRTLSALIINLLVFGSLVSIVSWLPKQEMALLYPEKLNQVQEEMRTAFLQANTPVQVINEAGKYTCLFSDGTWAIMSDRTTANCEPKLTKEQAIEISQYSQVAIPCWNFWVAREANVRMFNQSIGNMHTTLVLAIAFGSLIGLFYLGEKSPKLTPPIIVIVLFGFIAILFGNHELVYTLCFQIIGVACLLALSRIKKIWQP